jgi:hypothetical protein
MTPKIKYCSILVGLDIWYDPVGRGRKQEGRRKDEGSGMRESAS